MKIVSLVLNENMFLDIVKRFGEVERVKSIFVRDCRGEVRIFVVIMEDRWDPDLRDVLLDIEYDIRKRFPDVVFQFSYLPWDRLSEVTLDCLKESCYIWERR
jgi:hypothetical protein